MSRRAEAEDWEAVLADIALATGWELERVARLTLRQVVAIQGAMARHWERVAATSGFGSLFGGGKSGGSKSVSVDERSRLEATKSLNKRVELLKKTTGRSSFTIEEVLSPC